MSADTTSKDDSDTRSSSPSKAASSLDSSARRAMTGADLERVLPAFDPRRILFQGSGLLAVDKPAGLPVHASDDADLGLAELIAEWARLNPGLIEIKAGKDIHPLHLLDREATGVVLFGLKAAMRRRVQAALAAHAVSKRYLALVAGPLEPEGELRGRVRSKLRGRYRMMRSSLRYRLLHGDERLSLVECDPQEGRTHQIRALFASANRPLAGDLRYGRPKPAEQFREKFGVDHLLLHVLELTLPASVLGGARTIRAALPEHFTRVLRDKGWPVEEIVGALGESSSKDVP